MQAGAMQGLVIKGLVKEYVPGKPVLRGINLAIAPQGITAVIGPSGTGNPRCADASIGWSSPPLGRSC